jgi:hypothetical protein
MLCLTCGHFLKCPSCEDFVCPVCGSELPEAVHFNPVQAPIKIVATSQAA